MILSSQKLTQSTKSKKSSNFQKTPKLAQFKPKSSQVISALGVNSQSLLQLTLWLLNQKNFLRQKPKSKIQK